MREPLKRCKKCGEMKNESDFHHNPRMIDRRQSWCKQCTAKEDRNRSLLKNFSITRNKYNKMLELQNNVCLICGKPETHINNNGKINLLSVDHCHKTGKIRGLLCRRCNLTLGAINEDIKILKAAIIYLEKNQ